MDLLLDIITGGLPPMPVAKNGSYTWREVESASTGKIVQIGARLK
jgi:hypothetical protein